LQREEAGEEKRGERGSGRPELLQREWGSGGRLGWLAGVRRPFYFFLSPSAPKTTSFGGTVFFFFWAGLMKRG